MQSELAALQKQFAAMQAQSLAAARRGSAAFQQTGLALDDIRQSYLNNIKAMDAYDVRSHKNISQVEAYTKKLKDQKVHMVEAWQNRKLMNDVIKEQIALQRAQAVSWRKDSSGKIMSDLIIPKDAARGFETARMRLAMYNTMLRSVSNETVKWGKNTQWAGRQLMVGFTLPMGIAAAAAGKMAYDMDKALTQITKVYGDATQEFQDSSESIRAAALQTAENMAGMYGQSVKDTLEIQAQFAAAGQTGAELQQSTAAATKARMLNEIDLQTAIQATISMQTVYGQSAKQTGEAWDYINAVANQTILSAEDFAVAIPKVSGLLQELGADLKDVGVFMTAMKAGGIEAAEGANALKTISFRAVAPYNRGMETFKQATGADLGKLVQQANGQLIPLLDMMIERMEGLDAATKTQVFKDVFGIHQGNKALILLEQLANRSGQVANALAVGDNSVAENAAIAAQELARMNAQPYKRIEKAIELIKYQMGELGKVVLPVVASVLEFVGTMVGGINKLEHWQKVTLLIGAGLVAMAGPITMLAGLFGNLVGNLGKLFTAFGGIITRFKITDAAERAQILVGKQAAQGWDRQTGAVARLTQELTRLNGVMQQYTALQAQSMGVGAGAVPNGRQRHVLDPNFGYVAPAYTRDANGRAREKGRFIGADRVAQLDREAAIQRRINRQQEIAERKKKAWARDAQIKQDKAVIQAREQAEADRESAAHARSRAQGIAAGVAAGGALMSIMSDNSMVTGIGNTMLMVGMLGTMMPGVLAKIGTGFKSLGSKVGGATSKLGALKTAAVAGASSMMAFAGSIALPLTAIAAGLGLLWFKAREDAQEAAAEMKAIADSTETWAKTLGYNMMTPGELAKERGAKGQDLVAATALSIRENNQALADALAGNAGRDIGDKWAIAINEGMKVKLSGGTTEAAEMATRTAMQIMGETFSDADFEVGLDVHVNFDDEKRRLEALFQTMETRLEIGLSDEGAGWDKFIRDFRNSGQDDLTVAARESATEMAEQFWAAYALADEDGRREMIKRSAALYEGQLKAAFEASSNPMGKTFEDFLRVMDPDAGPMKKIDRAAFFPDIDDEQMTNLIRARDAMDAFIEPLMKANGLADKWHPGMGFHEVLELLGPTLATGASEMGGLQRAMSSAEQGANDLANALKAIGSDMEPDAVIDEWKSVMSGVQDDMVGAAMDSLSREAEASADALDREMDRTMDGFERRQDALEDKYDAKEEKQEDRQEKRRKSVEDYYDSRINKIDETIKAEKAAEEERQRIFEAEQRRQQRLAEMYNKNVDLNAAITSGNFDDAAKIANDMAASTAQWSAEDSNMATQTANEKRWAALEAEKDLLGQRKDARLEALRLTEEAEDKALERAKEREEERLQASKEASQKEFEDRKRTNQLMWEDRKRKLELELETIRAFIPRNKAEMDKQAADIDAAYRRYGGKLKGYGNDWAKYVGDSFVRHQATSANRLKSEIAWQSVGSEISKLLLKGGFGMTPGQFAKWLNGGAAPAGSVFGAQGTGPAYSKNATAENDKRHSHTGSIAGKTQGKRTGWSGKHNSQSEIDVTVLKGQGILTRKATDMIGEENVMALNKGKLPPNTGPWDMGMGGVAAAITSGVTKRLMQETFKAVIARKQAMDYGSLVSPGSYGNIKLSQEQLNNASTIMNVGKGMGATQRDLIIALMTAMQESTLRNLRYGDRDSIGLFQQRPSQGWGTVDQILDPHYSSRKFFESLFRVKDRNKMPLTMAAQAVQRSAYPMAYAKWEQMARALAGASATGLPGFGQGINMAQYGVGGSPSAGGWVRPSTGRVTSEYGMRVNPVTGVYKLHGGIDLGAPTGSPIYAAKSGVVSRASWENSRGNFTIVDHGGGVQTGYAHQSQMFVRPGQMVGAGQRIGAVGATGNVTGPHLHFEYYRNGARLNPRQIIPAFSEGGYTLNTGLGMLHPRETVLSEPLSNDLHEGLNKFAQGGTNQYTVEVNFHGTGTPDEGAIKRGVKKAITELEREKGPKRRIGDK